MHLSWKRDSFGLKKDGAVTNTFPGKTHNESEMFIAILRKNYVISFHKI